MAEAFPIQSIDDLPEHLRPFAEAADQGLGYSFPEPVTPCVVEFDPDMTPDLAKTAAFAAQIHDCALLMSFYTISIWGDCVLFEQGGMPPADVEVTLAQETSRAMLAYQTAMAELYAHHGHSTGAPVTRKHAV